MTKFEQNAKTVRRWIESGGTHIVMFKWTKSKGRWTYNYNICTCLIDGEKVGQCMRGGYDMKGEAFAEFINSAYREELLALDAKGYFYGLRGYNGFIYGSCGLDTVKDIFKALGFRVSLEYGISSNFTIQENGGN